MENHKGHFSLKRLIIILFLWKKILLLSLLFINKLPNLVKHIYTAFTAQNNLVGDHYLYISTPSTTNVNLKIIENGGAVITGTVSNTSLRILYRNRKYYSIIHP
jgi:hypothetical protein